MNAKKAPAVEKSADGKLSFYRAWCKRCGNCIAFCPRSALKPDEWGHPVLEDPKRCTSCGLCEMLCPDFAIAVGSPEKGKPPIAKSAAPGSQGTRLNPTRPSPERLAVVPAEEEAADGKK